MKRKRNIVGPSLMVLAGITAFGTFYSFTKHEELKFNPHIESPYVMEYISALQTQKSLNNFLEDCNKIDKHVPYKNKEVTTVLNSVGETKLSLENACSNILVDISEMRENTEVAAYINWEDKFSYGSVGLALSSLAMFVAGSWLSPIKRD